MVDWSASHTDVTTLLMLLANLLKARIVTV
jgi:hypothetical protein